MRTSPACSPGVSKRLSPERAEGLSPRGLHSTPFGALHKEYWMRLLTKLMRLQAALAEVIEELDDEDQVHPLDQQAGEEAEILLTRSAKNRRSDENEVMTMTPLNGAPAVPESWIGRSSTKGAGPKNREVLAKILNEYAPMPRAEVWRISRKLDPRLKAPLPQKNFQQMVNRFLKLGRLRLKSNKLVMGA